MNTREAFNETMKLIDCRTDLYDMLDHPIPESLGWPHLKEMWDKVKADNNPQGGTFSEGKLNRWLGWVQASGVAIGALTLDECKEINKKWSDG